MEESGGGGGQWGVCWEDRATNRGHLSRGCLCHAGKSANAHVISSMSITELTESMHPRMAGDGVEVSTNGRAVSFFFFAFLMRTQLATFFFFFLMIFSFVLIWAPQIVWACCRVSLTVSVSLTVCLCGSTRSLARSLDLCSSN